MPHHHGRYISSAGQCRHAAPPIFRGFLYDFSCMPPVRLSRTQQAFACLVAKAAHATMRERQMLSFDIAVFTARLMVEVFLRRGAQLARRASGCRLGGRQPYFDIIFVYQILAMPHHRLRAAAACGYHIRRAAWRRIVGNIFTRQSVAQIFANQHNFSAARVITGRSLSGE